jgi:hypothetical protein
MWKSDEYKGFEIHVLAVVKHGPPTPDIPYWFNGFVCRPGDAGNKEGGRKVFFSRPATFFDTQAEASDAGFTEGKAVIDGNHPVHSVDGL